MPTLCFERCRGKIRSCNGGWLVGRGVFCHGFDMMEELVGKASYFQVLILNATGRLVERRLADWFEARHICMSWPDPRIWCNQIGAMGGTLRTSVAAATTAGILGADSVAYGGSRTSILGIRFIQGALLAKKNGSSAREIVAEECLRHGGKPKIMGYARPIAKGDERIPAMERVSEKLGFEVGEHLSLAYEINEVLQNEFDEGMNINGYVSAFLADQNFTGEEVARIGSVLVASGVTACYIDTLNRPAESFLPLHCSDIEYLGRPIRPVPFAG